MPSKKTETPRAPGSILAGLSVAAGPPPKGAARNQKDAPVACPGLNHYAALYRIKAEIEAVLKGHAVKVAVAEMQVSKGRAAKRAPASFNTFEGQATANNQLRKKNTTQALNPDQKALCDDLGIPLEKRVTVPGAVIVNPKYMPEIEAVETLVDMANKAGFPPDFFQIQEERATYNATDESLTAVFSLGGNFTDDRVEEILRVVAQEPTVFSKWNGTLEEALAIASAELTGEKKPKGDADPAPAVRGVSLADVINNRADAAPETPAGGLMAKLKASLAAEAADDVPAPAVGGKASEATRVAIAARKSGQKRR